MYYNKERMNSFKDSEFVNLCKDVMTGNVVMTQQTFFRRVSENLFTHVDPITKYILTKNVNGLYTFLITMSVHPMCVPLSHAMTNTFTATLHVDSKDISKVLAKHNTEYSLEPNVISINKKARAFGCPYDLYFEHILGDNRRMKGIGRIKVIMLYHESDSTSPSAVEFKLNIPFKTPSKPMYIDITGEPQRSKGGSTITFVRVNKDYRLIDTPHDDIFYGNTSIGKAIIEYYEMWKEKEKFLARVYQKFTKHVKWMYFTDC